MSKLYLPKIARIESCIKCQLKCKCCNIKEFYDENPPKNYYLTANNFNKFIKKNRFIKIVELSNNGEMLLNPELKDIIIAANKNKVVLTARTGVNFNYASDDVLETMVKYKFHSMNIAIDGTSQETYSEYRVNGNFEKVISNIKRLNYYKEKYNSQYPILYYQFIIFGHNEHEMPEAKKLAKALNMKLYFKRNLFHEYSPIKNPDFVAKELNLPKIVVEANENGEEDKIKSMQTCTQLWFEPQIQCDGTFLGCCCQYFDSNLNVFELGLKKVLENEKIKNSKKVLCNEIEEKDNIICKDCGVYAYRKKTKSYITQSMIEDTKNYIEKYIKDTYIY